MDHFYFEMVVGEFTVIIILSIIVLFIIKSKNIIILIHMNKK